MDKEAARELVKELTSALEDHERNQLVPIVRKASRLATIVGDDLHRTIFEIHLEGLVRNVVGTGRVTRLSQPETLSAFDLAALDRKSATKDEGFTAPLFEIERTFVDLEKLADFPRLQSIDDAIRDVRLVRVRIANRVNTFVNNAVMLLSRMPEQVEPPSLGVRCT